MAGIKEPEVSYQVEDDCVLQITEYTHEDTNRLRKVFDDPNYTQIPNQLIGSCDEDPHNEGKNLFIPGIMSDMTESELKVCLVLCRMTYGFHRPGAYGSVRFLEKMTGLSRQGVLNGIERLIDRGLFSREIKPGKAQEWTRNSVPVPSEISGQQSRPQAVNKVDRTGLQSRPKKESIKESTNKLPPSTKAEPQRPVKADVGKLLKSTMTKGENEIDRSPLAEYIGQQLNSPVPQGKCNNLAMGYTEHLPGGKTLKHPSPDELWTTHPKFPEWVDMRIAYFKGQGGSNAAKRNKAINAICQYKGNKFAWLEWVAEQPRNQEEIVTVNELAKQWADEPDAKPPTETPEWLIEARKKKNEMLLGKIPKTQEV